MIALILAVSCTNQMTEKLEGEGVLTLSVCQETGKATSLSGTSPNVGDITWTYRLTKNDDGVVTGEVPEETKMSGTSVSKSVSYGSWKAEVWGYRDTLCRELVYLGSGTGIVAKGGGSIAVSAATTTDAEMARALSGSDTPKSTADLILRPIAVEGDEGGLVGKKCQWILDGAVIATWTSTDGTWYDDATGNAIPDSGETLYIAPGTGRSLVLSVKDTDGTFLGAEGWQNTDIALNCTYTVQGTLVPRNGSLTITISVSVLSGIPVYGTSLETVEVQSLFNINPSTEMPADNAIVIGYRKGSGSGVNTSDLSGAITYPFECLASEVKDTYAPSELGLEPIYVTSFDDLKASGADKAWLGSNATTGKNNPPLENNRTLTAVKFVDGLTAIRDGALKYCENLSDIVIPDGITSIGDFAFHQCKSLKSIVVPAGVTKLGYGAFNMCSGVENIDLPDGLTSIGKSAFNYCTNLKSITLPEGITAISRGMFRGCTSLGSITIPDSVTTIDAEAFSICPALKTMVIGSGITTIDSSAFTERDVSAGYETQLELLCIDRTQGSLDLSGFSLPSTCTVKWRGQF